MNSGLTTLVPTRSSFRFLALVLVWTSSRIARADSPSVDGRPRGLECAEVDPGARRHDGFFFRSDTGLSFLSVLVSGTGGSSGRTDIHGFGQSESISIGGTPERGLVIGGMAWTARIAPVFVENGKTIVPDDDSVKILLLRLGPFLDWYPDPAAGFHAQLAAAFTAQVETDVKGNAVKPAALGAALSIGTGYEWFISDEFSLGLLGRMAVGRAVREPTDGEQRMLWMVPELALTATYH